MKNILVLSAGTGTAWSICNAIKQVGGDAVNLTVCDTNPPWLVHTSAIADGFLQVPPIVSQGYYEHMLRLMEQHHIEILVPLIDWDMELFYRDNPDLCGRGVFSTAPRKETFQMLSNKKNLWNTMGNIGIATPRIFEPAELDDETEYFVKPEVGFGARNTGKFLGKEIKARGMADYIVQELCQPLEITADVFCHEGKVRCVCRERIETKAGVCTKARVFYDAEIEGKLSAVAKAVDLPEICCVQFMKNAAGEWTLTDFNLRLGAGSALSAAVGFRMAEAAAAIWLGMPEKISVRIPEEERYVVRHYSELVTK